MKFERKGDFGSFGPFLGSKNGPFWAKNAFLAIFFYLLIVFCLNLAKNCKNNEV